MNILVLGSGGREHALCVALRSEGNTVYAIPGSDAISEIAVSIPNSLEDAQAIFQSVQKHQIDLVVVGPEMPLIAGVADFLRAKKVPVLGPSASAAQLEGSKSFMKNLCYKYNIPTAKACIFDDLQKAIHFIHSDIMYPLVIKADGLASGKGVIIAHNRGEAHNALHNLMYKRIFGASGAIVLIEEFLCGRELSYFALCDGHKILSLGAVCDYKTLYNGNMGPNTGGMGAYTPVPWCDIVLEKKIKKSILEPLVNAMKQEGRIYTGVLFLGLMIVEDNPFLLECNVRFGDPECQTLLQTCTSRLTSLFESCANGLLLDEYMRSSNAVVTVVLASKGYPGIYEHGVTIPPKSLCNDEGIFVFHAGTKKINGHFCSCGGRVLNITATAETVFLAQKKVYNFIKKRHLDELFIFRTDIGEV